MTQHEVTGSSFLPQRHEYPMTQLDRISNCSHPHQPLWVTFNYCRPFGAALKYSYLDDSILISIWNYPIISSGSWLRLDVFLSFFFLLHFPNFSQTGLAEPRGGPGEKFNLQLEPDEHFKLHTLGWRAFFLSGWDQQEARLYTDGEKRNRSYATLHSGDNRVFTAKVSRRLFQSKQEFSGLCLGGEVFDGRKSAAIWKHNKSGVRGGPAACPLCVTVCSR